MEIKGKKFNFLGDSITEGVGASDVEHSYSQVFGKIAEAAAARNYGVSGTRIAAQHNPTVDCPSFDEHFLLRAVKMDKDADFVVVFGGTNDYGHGDAHIGNPTDRTSETFYGALHELFTTLINRFPESTIVVMTPLHRECENNPSAATGYTLKQYVEIIREVAEVYGLPVLDLYKMGGIVPDVPISKETYAPDGLHPNDKGHELVAQRLKSFLLSL